MIDLSDVASEIKKRRKERGLTQAELARLSGVSRTRIIGLETEQLPEIGLRTLTRLLAALDLDLRIVSAGRRPTLDDLRAEQET